MKKKAHSLNVLLDKDQYTRLKSTANELDISMGALVRRLIEAAYKMHVLNLPTCASGQACYAPHMHPQQLPLPQSDTPTP